MKALASIRQSQLALPRVKAALIPIALLLPLWTLGIFARSYWKPDEPREAAIVWRMHLSGNTAVPALAETPFVEKPPLLYWAAKPFMNDGRAAPWRPRLPNVLYATVTALCVFLLASELMSTSGAIVATLITGSFLINLQVAIWLATDAPLMAGVALSLVGLYRGYRASDDRTKLIYYTLMHGGLTLAFMAKSAAAWLVPGCTFITLMIWDRNYRELLRWPLYAGLIIEIACIGSWLWFVAQAPQGRDLLHQLLWMNLAGRFASIHSSSPAIAEYAQEHRNWFGKYLLEAPYFVFPWTLIVIAAIQRGWQSMRRGIHLQAWRFCVASVIPALVLLSVAHTGRDIYVTPLLIGVGIACGMWLDTTESRLERMDILALRGSRWLIAALGAVLIGALPLTLKFIRAESMALWPSLVGGGIIAIALARLFMSTPAHSSVGERIRTLYGAYMLIIVGTGLAYFPMLNRQQDLMPIAAALRADLHGHPLALVVPDETTRAFVDLEGLTAGRLIRPESLVTDTQALLKVQPETRFLIQLNERRGPLTDWLPRKRSPRRPDEALIDALTQAGLTMEKRYAVPDGRSYALFARTS